MQGWIQDFEREGVEIDRGTVTVCLSDMTHCKGEGLTAA